MKPERVNSSFAIPVPLEDFKRIITWESNSPTDQRRLNEEIDNIEGVDNCDYNGHFGPYIFYRVAAINDRRDTHKKIMALIKAEAKKLTPSN